MKWQLLIISILTFSACGNHHDQGPQNEQAEHEHSDPARDELTLNSGQKWKVNPEMKPPIEQAESALETYLHNKDTNYHALADTLQAYNTALIQSCTMEGQSHEELHKWLYPHIDLIKELGSALSLAESETITSKLVDSYNLYHQHFQ